jgi:hypothetical protein
VLLSENRLYGRDIAPSPIRAICGAAGHSSAALRASDMGSGHRAFGIVCAASGLLYVMASLLSPRT